MAELPNSMDRLVTIFGGSGFLGRHVVRALAARGWRIRVGARQPSRAFALPPSGDVGQIHTVQANVRDPASIERALRGADAAINLVGILEQGGKQTFDSVQAAGAQTIAQAVAKAGIGRFIHFSAIGADANSDSHYAVSKAQGEQAVLTAKPDAVIFRPSIVFGAEDHVFNRFGALARAFWVLPVVGAACRVQPVFVDDIAEAVARALEGAATPGATYELGGPDIVTMKEIAEWTCLEAQRQPPIWAMPEGLARIFAFVSELATIGSLGMYPKDLRLTGDQVKLLNHDNVVSDDAAKEGRTLAAFDLPGRSYRAITPTYLWRYRKAGQYDTRRLA